MKFLKFIPISLLLFSSVPMLNNKSLAENDSKEYKILSLSNDKLSIKNIEKFLKKGDEYVDSGDFDKAKESYDKARNLAKTLSAFYSDINAAFRGVDARIPREMDNKGRKSLEAWADSNARLAALYKRKNEPEVAVPLLVEIIRLMSPTSNQGKSAYNDLVELGFVDTPFKGF